MPDDGAAELARRGLRAPILRVLPGLMLAMLLGALDQTIMAPALPAVAADLGGLDQIPVLVTAYLVSATVVMPAYGKLGDRFGRPRLLMVAIGIFVVGALLCARGPVDARADRGEDRAGRGRRRADDRRPSGTR